MRFLSLTLERYGAFTDRVLTFRPDAKLHVVLGANEAGKSTALAAVTDLLFGFGKNTPYAFLHEMPAMRIGAEIAASDGRRLAVRRRKGNARTLVDAQDAALPDDALAPFLGGLSRQVFCNAFGLDAEALRRGGKEMVDVEGEVGASLFAAGSGLRGLTDLQAQLDGEAETIFTARKAGHRVFYQALDRYTETRRAERDSGLSPNEWRQLNDTITQAGETLDALRAERGRVAAARAKLERLKRAGPILAEIDGLAARLAAEPIAVEADGAWIARLAAVLAECRTADIEAARAAGALARAQAAVEALPPVPPLSERGEEILEAFRDIGKFEKCLTDLPRVSADADRASLALDRLCARVGVRDREALASTLPTDAARARIAHLLREGRTLDAAEAQALKEVETVRAERDRLVREGEAAGAVRDPAPLREALRPFTRLRDTLSRRDEYDLGLRQMANVQKNRLGRLVPPVADAAALARAPLPTGDVIARYHALLDGKARERQRAVDRHTALLLGAAEIRASLADREAERPVATQERLDALRAERDAAFAPVREALLSGRPADPSAFERLALAADRLADERATDATRIAAHTADLRRLDSTERDAAAETDRIAVIDAEIAQGEAAWREEWAAAGIAPTAPAEMSRWLSEAQVAIEAEQDMAEQALNREKLAKPIEDARAPLAALCERAGIEPLPGLDVAGILDRLDARLDALATRWEAERETIGRRDAARRSVERLEGVLRETQATRATWQAAWREALAVLGLPAESGLDEAEAALSAWRDVPDALEKHADFERRVRGIVRDRDQFQTTAAALVAALAPDLADMSPAASIRTLHGRLEAAQGEAVRRTELLRQQEAAAQMAREAQADADAGRHRLLALVGERLPDAESLSLDDMTDLHARLHARESMRADLARLRERELAAVGEGQPEAELRAGLAETPSDAIEAGLAALASEADEIEERSRIVYAERERDIARRTALEGGTGAELALAERKAAEAQMQDSARSWAVLRLAGLMLGAAVARHRAGQQDPMIARAGELFRQLTGGAFAGLAQSYDEDDTPKLVGRRAGEGKTVEIDGMSEGTRDQLYLALRLAHLEDFSRRAEPAPFIGDDLFLTFDDARTGHGLEALAAIGDRVQPILFTHHRHVAEIAAARLGQAVDVLTL